MYGKSISVVECAVLAVVCWIVILIARYIAYKWDMVHGCHDESVIDSPIAKQLKSMKKAYNEKK